MFHILIVDDDKNIRRFLRAVLEAERYTVTIAEDGKAALAVMDREHINIIWVVYLSNMMTIWSIVSG